MALPFFTIGHSNRSFEVFAALLQEYAIAHLADIRKIPMSRANPQFNRDSLPQSLKAIGISYEHIAALGGLRGKSPNIAPDINGAWKNDSFHRYADYALSAPFHNALEHLRGIGHQQRTAIMCAEAVWWRCHRRIVTDYLIAKGETVFHILDKGHMEQAHLSPDAHIQPDGTLVYPTASPLLL